MYDKREIFIPLAGILIFVGAVVLMVWGDELGALSLIRQVPPLLVLAIFIGALVIAFRMRPSFGQGPGGLPRPRGSQGWLPLILIGFLAFAFFMFILSQVIRF